MENTGEVLNPDVQNILTRSPELPSEVTWLTRFRERARNLLKREQRAGDPKIDITIFYSPHDVPEDMDGLSAEFNKADIYIPEAFGWDNATLESYNTISEISSPEKLDVSRIKDPITAIKVKMIAGSHKKILMIDVPNGHPIEERDSKLEEEGKILKLKAQSLAPSFRNILDEYKNWSQKSSMVNKDREDYMLSKLPIELQNAVKGDPQLRAKQRIRVLLSLGAGHQSVFHALRETEDEVTRKFNESPFTGSFSYEIDRRLRLGKQVDNTLLGRGLLELCTFDLLEEMTKHFNTNAYKNMSFARIVISEFSFEEIKIMFQTLWKEPKRGIIPLLYERLKEKGIDFPMTSKKQFDTFLASRGKVS